ncbi:MAG: nodulation protein NfeD [Micromonosporaceae bacterium]|nr:nodulation protein NfeD [Micromonosporaceae bacterium]
MGSSSTRFWLGVAACLVAAVVASPGLAAARSGTVLVARVDGPITPVIADYLADGVSKATRAGHEALLVELDTPGGLDTSMRDIIQAFLSAEVPVVVYVTPSGARAASAGALITFAGHIAAMAPGTTIGAATPVNAETGETASDKVINDAASFAESVARQRGRDAEFAVATVRDGRSVTAEEAQRVGAVDLLARNRAELLRILDQRTVSLASGEAVTLRTASATVEEYGMGWSRRLLAVLADPNLAFLFLSIGTLAVIYELATPGMGLGGVAGAVLLVLGLFALSVLPVAVAGLALLVLAAALFAAEVLTPGVGVFATGGTIALVAAGLFLFEGEEVRVSPAVLLPTAVVVGGGTLLAGRLAWRARNAPAAVGMHTLIGATATVRAAPGPTWQVQLAGTWWNARSDQGGLREGQQVRVIETAGLTVIVAPEDTIPPNETTEEHHA